MASGEGGGRNNPQKEHTTHHTAAVGRALRQRSAACSCLRRAPSAPWCTRRGSARSPWAPWGRRNGSPCPPGTTEKPASGGTTLSDGVLEEAFGTLPLAVFEAAAAVAASGPDGSTERSGGMRRDGGEGRALLRAWPMRWKTPVAMLNTPSRLRAEREGEERHPLSSVAQSLVLPSCCCAHQRSPGRPAAARHAHERTPATNNSEQRSREQSNGSSSGPRCLHARNGRDERNAIVGLHHANAGEPERLALAALGQGDLRRAVIRASANDAQNAQGAVLFCVELLQQEAANPTFKRPARSACSNRCAGRLQLLLLGARRKQTAPWTD